MWILKLAITPEMKKKKFFSVTYRSSVHVLWQAHKKTRENIGMPMCTPSYPQMSPLGPCSEIVSHVVLLRRLYSITSRDYNIGLLFPLISWWRFSARYHIYYELSHIFPVRTLRKKPSTLVHRTQICYQSYNTQYKSRFFGSRGGDLCWVRVTERCEYFYYNLGKIE